MKLSTFALAAVALPFVYGTPVVVAGGATSLDVAVSLPRSIAGRSIVEADRSRYANTMSKLNKRSVQKRDSGDNNTDVFVYNTGMIYQAYINIGTPTQSFVVFVDTGSSNTWVGADPDKPYNLSLSITGKDEGKAVNVSYGSGEFQGNEYTDTISLSPYLTIPAQSFGNANSSQGFAAIDGILGLGPTALTEDTVQGDDTVPTVLDNLVSAGLISQHVFGISFSPVVEGGGLGSIDFGQPDSSKYQGEVIYTDIPTGPISQVWGLNASFSYGNASQTLQHSSSGFIDTGTTFFTISNDAFNAYQQATGAEVDNNTGLLKVTKEQFDKMESMFVTVGDSQLELTKDAQAWPKKLNSQVGGDKDAIYLAINSDGQDGSNSGFILGYTFLQRFYSVFDADQKRVGLATTQYTNAQVNV